MNTKDTLFVEVDCQRDFVMPDGKLPVKGADMLIDKINDIRRFVCNHKYNLVASMDWHMPNDAELSETPNFKTTFPSHCMANTKGAVLVGQPMYPFATFYMWPNKSQSEDIRRFVGHDFGWQAIIHKDQFDAFTNPNTALLLDVVKPKHVVVFGVALDVCVRFFLEGLLKHKSVGQVTLLTDVTKGLGIVPDSEQFNKFQNNGIVLKTWEEVKRTALK